MTVVLPPKYLTPSFRLCVFSSYFSNSAAFMTWQKLLSFQYRSLAAARCRSTFIYLSLDTVQFQSLYAAYITTNNRKFLLFPIDHALSPKASYIFICMNYLRFYEDVL